ncbi:Ferrochelatase [Austwickia sp. TVS 96-490-7B]|uniref:ferrochelatase n=1 Tax=Austwickia sp. TVS 96-490-7B TaxID=2830843 RepID=UPI001C588BB2|nr:ferrochelatase [Austwickia sp. TVS 96-490-7B]MBW3086151.1 Ferrochelatase [Austwickia sp. TVS 96-490-7B]
MPTDALAPYDAVLIHSFGGPERQEDVLPFLERVTGGRGIPRERLEEVGSHYTARGGRSPINDETRALRDALATELERRGAPRPVVWGNRFAEPFTAQTLTDAAEHGWRRLIAITTSAYPSYSGCRSYREDLASALTEIRRAHPDMPLHVDRISPYATHPGFSQTTARLAADAVAALLQDTGLPADSVRLVCVTHSIPHAQDDMSGLPPGGAYTRWHHEITAAVTHHVAVTHGLPDLPDLAYCSRSGPPTQPWLEPDISDRITALAADGVRGVVVAPVGFTADHMEVVYDLDETAAAVAHSHAMAFTRVPTVRCDPEFVAALADLITERAAQVRDHDDISPRAGDIGCARGCCPNPRGWRPAVGEDDVEPTAFSGGQA